METSLEYLAAAALITVLCVATLAISGGVAWKGARDGQLHSIFFAVLFLQLALGIVAFAGGTQRPDLETLVFPMLFYFACTALTAFWLLRGDTRVTSANDSIRATRDESPGARIRRRTMSLCFLAPVVLLLLRHATSSGGWIAYRESSGPLDVAAVISSFFLGPMALINARRRGYVMAASLVAGLLAVVVVVGTRVPLVAAIFAVLIDVFWVRGARLRLLPAVTLAALGFGLHVFGRIVRGVGTEALLAVSGREAIADILRSYFQQDEFALVNALSGGESQILRYYFDAFAHASEFQGFMTVPTLIRAALVLVPSSVIPKPVDVSAEAWTLSINQNWADYSGNILTQLMEIETVGSVHFSIWGDAYVNAGVLGVVVYPALLAFALRRLDRVFSGGSYERKLLLGSVFGMAYAAMVRGAVVNSVGFIVYGAVLLAMVDRLSGVFGSGPKTAPEEGPRQAEGTSQRHAGPEGADGSSAH